MDKIKSLTERIDKLSASFESEFTGLLAADLNWKPAPQVWSIAQIIDHLINIYISYLPVIEYAKSDNYKVPFTAHIPGLPAVLGKAILKTVHPDNRRKSRTFNVWEPSLGDLSTDILKTFLKHNDQLKQLIIQSAPLLERKIIISSPSNKYIVYSLDHAFEIIVTHEERHFKQAVETKELLKKTFAEKNKSF